MTHDPAKPKFVESDCLEAFDYLYAYLNGDLQDKESIVKMEHHLSHCRSCFSRAQMERELNNRIKKSGKKKSPKSLQNRLRHLMDKF